MQYQDYYHTLGVTRAATAEEIKKAYRRLARKYHPDVSKEPQAEERFKEVQEAYEVLKDPEKRAAYDQLGAEWKQGEQFRPPPDWGSGFEFRGGPDPRADARGGRARGGARHAGAGPGGGFEFQGDAGQFSDFFASLFGAQGGPFAAHGRRGGSDHHARVEVDIEEAFRGATRMLELKRPKVTADGQVELEAHTIRVTIPAGVTDGQLIRLAGQGEAGTEGGAAGDLYLEVHVRPSTRYQLDGRDVTLTLPVAPWEAALGASVTVPTLGGSVELKIPPGSQSGSKLRLRGRGFPGQPAGDQYVVLKVVLPPASSAEARAAYERLQRDLPFNPRAGL